MCAQLVWVAALHRHLYYIGGERGGLLGLVDASEMPDTYGSSFDEVRGFTATGWPAVGNHVGDLHDRGEFFRIGLAVCVACQACTYTHTQQPLTQQTRLHLCALWLGSGL